MRFLQGQLNELRAGKRLGEKEGVAVLDGKKGKEEVELPGECYAVRINSGKFGVPWEDTKRVLEGGGVDMVVLRPEEEEGSVEGGGKMGKAGAKRKVGDEGGDEEVKGHAGLAKRRKKRGLDGWLEK